MQFLSKWQQGFLVDIDKITLKFIWKVTGPRIAETILNEKKKVGGITPPDTKDYLLYTYSNQDSVVLAKGQTHRSMNRMENSGIASY